MKTLDCFEMAVKASAYEGKYAVYTSNYLDINDDADNFIHLTITKALGHLAASSVLSDTKLLTLFDTKKEMLKFFEVFNNDPVYASAIFACTISPTKGILDTNT